MITGFEVGALFQLRDEMSPGLRKILESMRELNKVIASVRENLAGFSGAVTPGLTGAITQVNELTAAWERAGAASVAAARMAAGSARSAGAAAAVGGGGGASVRQMAMGLGGGSGRLGLPHVAVAQVP